VISTRRLPVASAALAVTALLAGCGQGAGTGASHLAAISPAPKTAGALQQQFGQVVRTVSPQVVQIQSAVGLGSGVVFDRSGDIVTNAHVVGSGQRFTVTLAAGARHPATLVGADRAHDLAVIRLVGTRPAPAAFADPGRLHVGDFVLAIGNPLGLRSSVTEGIVSSLGRTVGEGGGVTLSTTIQTSAAINPGNSGGALVDLAGQVIGIPTLAALDPEFGDAQANGIGFAIPSSTVAQVATRIIAGT
jgi:putative serine protease PepD